MLLVIVTKEKIKYLNIIQNDINVILDKNLENILHKC